jgi:hypothetical protein
MKGGAKMFTSSGEEPNTSTIVVEGNRNCPPGGSFWFLSEINPHLWRRGAVTRQALQPSAPLGLWNRLFTGDSTTLLLQDERPLRLLELLQEVVRVHQSVHIPAGRRGAVTRQAPQPSAPRINGTVHELTRLSCTSSACSLRPNRQRGRDYVWSRCAAGWIEGCSRAHVEGR